MWTSTDPMEQDWSSYAYCAGNPVNTVDENGEWGEQAALLTVKLSSGSALSLGAASAVVASSTVALAAVTTASYSFEAASVIRGALSVTTGIVSRAALPAALLTTGLLFIHSGSALLEHCMTERIQAQAAAEMAAGANKQASAANASIEMAGVTNPTPPPDWQDRESWTEKTHGHHSIPREIQKKLPQHIRTHPDIIGRKGLPNIRPANAGRHLLELHRGSGGGLYNRLFEEEILKRGGYTEVSVQDVLEIRDLLLETFNL